MLVLVDTRHAMADAVDYLDNNLSTLSYDEASLLRLAASIACGSYVVDINTVQWDKLATTVKEIVNKDSRVTVDGVTDDDIIVTKYLYTTLIPRLQRLFHDVIGVREMSIKSVTFRLTHSRKIDSITYVEVDGLEDGGTR